MDWKYQLQDLVTTRAILAETRAQYLTVGTLHFCTPGHVIERRSSECSAGVQRSYLIECKGALGLFHEDSLAPATELFALWTELSAKTKDKEE